MSATSVQSTPKSKIESDAWQIARAEDVSILARIHDPAVGLAMWKRQVRLDLRAWLALTDADLLPAGRVLADLNDIRAATEAIFDMSGTPDGPAAGILIGDIVDLAERFAAIAETDRVDIRLEVLDHDACWKFHQDRVPLRMLTTYLGPGTQYVEPHDSDQALREQRAYSGIVHDIPEQAVALFKGTLCDTGNGVVHRSPAVAETGETRLLLCLNPPSPSSPEPWRRDRRLDITGAIQSRLRPVRD